MKRFIMMLVCAVALCSSCTHFSNGEIECYATERLEAHTTGMGEIKYQGPAGLQVVSSGRVIRDID